MTEFEKAALKQLEAMTQELKTVSQKMDQLIYIQGIQVMVGGNLDAINRKVTELYTLIYRGY